MAEGPDKMVMDLKYRWAAGWERGVLLTEELLLPRSGWVAGLACVHSLKSIWGDRLLKVCDRVAVYKPVVLPTFLSEAKTWNCTDGSISGLGCNIQARPRGTPSESGSRVTSGVRMALAPGARAKALGNGCK